MARRIRLDQIGDYSEEKLNQLMRVVVLETDAELKARSPVDTGRFRASWVVGENQTGSYDAGETSVIPPIQGINYQPGNEKIGNTYNVHNSLVYAEALANGHSPQAPAGWIDIVARQMTNRARQLAEQIGRQD
jgi:hypothetical protein